MNHLIIDLSSQRLTLLNDEQPVVNYLVSTAKNGAGEQFGSQCTPRGRHIIRAKIGASEPVNRVFVARRPTNQIYSTQVASEYPNQDWVLTRILWLSGCEVGRNRLGKVDTMRRYIYIHGTPDCEPMGIPLSHGCVRMRNFDILDLFDRVLIGTPVDIIE